MIRVATLNIWGRQGPWPSRLALIRQELTDLNPDVIGLQEVWRHEGRCQAEEIAGDLGYEIAYAPAFTAEDGRIQGNAILTRLPITAQHHIPLPVAGHEPRALLYVQAGDLPVYVTHLNWQPDHSAIRQEQARFITAHMTSSPAVLLGDFNATPDSPEIQYLSGHFTDAWTTTGDGTAGDTFSRENAFVSQYDDEPTRRLDYIFTSAHPTRTWLTFTTPKDNIWPSDHYGLACDLTLTDLDQ
ncbi:endonuclease/exonuclease/phosphatase family protein [Nonomuraea sp. NPDC055795]